MQSCFTKAFSPIRPNSNPTSRAQNFISLVRLLHFLVLVLSILPLMDACSKANRMRAPKQIGWCSTEFPPPFMCSKFPFLSETTFSSRFGAADPYSSTSRMVHIPPNILFLPLEIPQWCDCIFFFYESSHCIMVRLRLLFYLNPHVAEWSCSFFLSPSSRCTFLLFFSMVWSIFSS